MLRVSNRKGVSLIEVMVVVVLIGILSALAVPRFGAYLSLQRLSADADRLALDFQQARTLASKTSARHYLVFSGKTWSLYRETSTPANRGFDGAATDSLVKKDSLSPGIRFGFASSFGTLPTPPSAVTGLASSILPSEGLAAGAAVDNCVDGTTSGTGTWDSTVVFCGSRGISDIETGALYLTSTVTSARVEALVYNDVSSQGSLRVQHWTWESGSWGRK